MRLRATLLKASPVLRASVGTAAPQACVPALGAAELVGAALEALAADADLLAAERARVRLLLVDLLGRALFVLFKFESNIQISSRDVSHRNLQN